MIKLSFKKILLITFLFTAYNSYAKNALWVSYNVENLFDDRIDGTEYKEFKDEKYWNSDVYSKKVYNIANAFDNAISNSNDVELVALQEIENENALIELKSKSKVLHNLDYIFAKDEKQATGIALLSKYKIIKKETKIYDKSYFNTNSKSVRPIIYAKLKIKYNLTTHVFAVHLPSNLNSTEEKILLRKTMLKFIDTKCSEILANDKNAYIVIMGDFNEENSSESIPSLNITYTKKYHDNNGTSYFNNEWWNFDQILLSTSFRYQKENSSPLRVTKNGVINKSFLLKKENNIKVPYRFNNGDGYSDHLPISVTIRYTPFNYLIPAVIIIFIILILTVIAFIIFGKNKKKERKILWVSYNIGGLCNNTKPITETNPSKVKNIARVFDKAISKKGGIELVCLQEVENKNSLIELKNKSAVLSKLTYYEFEKDKEQSTGLGLISNYKILEFDYLDKEYFNTDSKSVRPIIYAQLEINKGVILHLFNVHLPSKIENEKHKEKSTSRQSMLNLIHTKTMDILKKHSNSYIMVMGDFNEENSEKIITQLKNTYEHRPNIKGSYFYNNKWHKIDQILFSPAFLSISKNYLKISEFDVIKKDFLINNNGYPKSFDKKNNSGYSDHLPIYVEITKN